MSPFKTKRLVLKRASKLGRLGQLWAMPPRVYQGHTVTHRRFRRSMPRGDVFRTAYVGIQHCNPNRTLKWTWTWTAPERERGRVHAFRPVSRESPNMSHLRTGRCREPRCPRWAGAGPSDGHVGLGALVAGLEAGKLHRGLRSGHQCVLWKFETNDVQIDGNLLFLSPLGGRRPCRGEVGSS